MTIAMKVSRDDNTTTVKSLVPGHRDRPLTCLAFAIIVHDLGRSASQSIVIVSKIRLDAHSSFPKFGVSACPCTMYACSSS